MSATQFAMIPHWLIKHGEVGRNELAVYTVLKMHQNAETGLCNPGTRTIATYTGLSKTMVNEARNRLRELGIIGWVTGGKGKSCRYWLAEHGPKQVGHIPVASGSHTGHELYVLTRGEPNGSAQPTADSADGAALSEEKNLANAVLAAVELEGEDNAWTEMLLEALRDNDWTDYHYWSNHRYPHLAGAA